MSDTPFSVIKDDLNHYTPLSDMIPNEPNVYLTHLIGKLNDGLVLWESLISYGQRTPENTIILSTILTILAFTIVIIYKRVSFFY